MEMKIVEKSRAFKEGPYKIDKVRNSGKYFQLDYKHMGCFLEKKYGVTPKAGDLITVYLHRGSMIRGIDINGKEVFFKTQAELDREHEEFCKKFKRDQWKDWRETMNRIKNDDSYETIDISGMSGSYEWGCQIMLQAGLKFLKISPTIDGKMQSFIDTIGDKPKSDFHFDYEQSPNIIGVCTTKTPWGKELDKVICDAPEKFGKQYGCTGAQHQAVINHLMYIYKHGYDAWLKQFPPERRYIYPQGLPPPKDD